MPIWKQNSMPQANNMDAKHCAGQTLILDFKWKRYLEGLFDGFSAQKKDPGFNLRRNYTLSHLTVSVVACTDFSLGVQTERVGK